MVPDRSRRRFLCVASLGMAAALAGCTSDVYVPEDLPGGPDLALKNCHAEAVDVHVIVTFVESGETVHDATHTIPGDFCSDVGPSYYVEEVWVDPGEYRIRAEVPGMGAAEATTTLSEVDVREDTGTRSIHVDDGEVDIYG